MIEVVLDDILKQDVDAIVNPANTHMLHGGGLAALIARQAGEALVRESQAKAPIHTGEAILTTAGDLPLKAVIHAVGPEWDPDNFNSWNCSRELLKQAHVNSVLLAALHGIHSLAFPAISCGIFHFPVERAAPIAIGAVTEALQLCPSVKRVVFCLTEDSHYDTFVRQNA